MNVDTQEKVIRTVQSSTKSLVNSFLNKTRKLMECSDDIKPLIRQGYDPQISSSTALEFFGKDTVPFIAIDGTMSQYAKLDILVFYCGAFGYSGKLMFKNDEKGTYYELSTEDENLDISSAIPIHESYLSAISSQQTEHGPSPINVDQDIQKIPSVLMQFAEYFMAVKSIMGPPYAKVVILDRQLAIDIGHLVSEATHFLEEDVSVLEGMNTSKGKISKLDLDLGRMLHPNSELKIPSARSQFIKYAAINELIRRTKTDNKKMVSSIEELLDAIGAKRQREKKLLKDLQKYDNKYSIFEKKLLIEGNKSKDGQTEKMEDEDGNEDDDLEFSDGNGIFDVFDVSLLKLKPGTEDYWERITSAVLELGEHIFNTPENEHPLLVFKNQDKDLSQSHSDEGRVWITVKDIQYMTLIMIYALLRAAWEKNILIIGLVKDIGAAELTKTIIPILKHTKMTSVNNILPSFGSDKMLLQINSIMDPEIYPPWRTFEFDSCFRTVAPDTSNEKIVLNQKIERFPDADTKIHYCKVKGAHKNLISPERMFVKAYIQLWGSQTDHNVKSHVFSYDRPTYPRYDLDLSSLSFSNSFSNSTSANISHSNDENGPEILLYHRDGNVDEEIIPIIHFKNDNKISQMVMSILFSMSQEAIPEAIGHNYPLFIADKKAKKMLIDAEPAYTSILSLELTKHNLEQQILFESKFRAYRSQIENKRRKNKSK